MRRARHGPGTPFLHLACISFCTLFVRSGQQEPRDGFRGIFRHVGGGPVHVHPPSDQDIEQVVRVGEAIRLQ